MTEARRQLLISGAYTFFFAGAISAAFWGEFRWEKVASVAICGAYWALQFPDVLKLAQKR